jgi:hypothetical protein
MPRTIALLANKTLVLDLIEWLAAAPRPYTEVMDAWRTSCPRLTVWEDALDHRFVAVRRDAVLTVEATAIGRAFLAAERPLSHTSGR